jgi:virulence factor Mce-like protein
VRRAVVVVVLLGLLAGAASVLAGAGGDGGASRARIDVIFDTAGFLIPGQDVKVAGAKAGKVVDVSVTDDFHARVGIEVDREFAPFRSDAACTIQPQSLIGEKFLQCYPGSPQGRPLRAAGDRPPTVPVENTSAPIDPDLLLATFRRPTIDRLAIILNELGAGLAARGDDLNVTIRRANPALQETNRVLRIVDRDRARVRNLIRAADRVTAELADRRDTVAAVVDRGARVASATAAERQDLEDAVAGLPPLLAQAQPALRDVETVAQDLDPVVADAQRAAPVLRRIAGQLGPLSDAARPALARLGSASTAGQEALRAATPVVDELRTFSRAARPTAALVQALFADLPGRGVPEGLQTFVYNAALAISRYDQSSHILPAYLIAGACSVWSTTTTPACDGHFAAGGRQAVARRRARTRRSGPVPRPAIPQPAAAPQTTPAPQPAAPQPARTAPAPKAPVLPQIQELLDELPKGLDGLVPGLGDVLREQEDRGKQPKAEDLQGLLEALLG